MRTTVQSAVLGSLVLLAACKQAEEPKKETAQEAPPPVIPMQDFFRNPERSGYQISPDGQYFAFRAPWHNRMNIFAQKVGDTTATQVTMDTIRDVGGYFWKGDRLLYSRDINGDENMIVFSASRDGKDVKPLTPQKGVRAGVMDDLHDVAGMEKSVIVQMNKRNPEVFDPYLVNIESGDTKPLYDNSKENFEGWVTDHTGVIRIATKTDGTDQLLFYRATDKEPFKQFMKVGYKDSFQPHMFTFDNKNIYAASNLNGRDKTAIVEYDIAANKEVKEIYANKDYDVDGIDYSRKRKVLTRVIYTGEKMETVYLDDQTKKLYEGLEAQFPGMEVAVASENDNEDKR
ncbi:MAG TPA: S9 family peptidase, partial [Flavobacteriales bacterium]|nr:S9 family peptidase [Flavobacteriales bacterium]